MKTLPQAFVTKMRAMLGGSFPAFMATYDMPPVRGIRVNTLKVPVTDFLSMCPWQTEPSPTAPDSLILTGEAQGIGRHPYHAAGLIYVQEPSAALPVAIAGIRPGMRVLDMCAAPGGKSGAAAAALKGEGLLVANEIVPNRARVLASTLERMGAVNAVVTSASPDAMAEALPRYFDVVLTDAPCSGEGMFRKDDTAIAEWSEAHVEACAKRQALILESAAKCVRGGGALIYSTCTFSPEENERTVSAFIEAHPDFTLEYQTRLYPHLCVGEGHFAARMRRGGNDFAAQPDMRMKRCKDASLTAFIQDTFTSPPAGEACVLPDGRVTLLRSPVPEGIAALRVLTSGVMAGELVKGRFEPSHTLFMAAGVGDSAARKLSYHADADELAAFLAGETLACPEDWRGYCAVCADGFTLGFGKADHGTLKNKLPKGLRMAR